MNKLSLSYYEKDDWFKDGYQVKWSASYITSLQKCKRYYFYSVLQRWRPKRDSIDLTFGGFVSAAVELYYQLYMSGMDAEECLIEVIHAVMTQSKDYEVFKMEELKTRRALVAALIDYFDNYSELDREEIVKVEQVFNLPVTEDITFIGKFDVVKKTDGVHTLLDQKTTKSTLSPMWFKTWTPNNQMSMYLYAGRVIFPFPISHIIVDAIQIMKSGTNFMRGVVSRTKAQLDEWYRGIMIEIQDAHARHPDNEADWPQNPSACGYFRGCEFRNVCSASPKLRKAYLKEEFKQ